MAGATSSPFPATLYEQDGPFTTICLDTRGDVEGAAQRIAVRWENVRKELAGEGVDSGLLDSIEARVAGSHELGDTLVVITDNHDVRSTLHLSSIPTREVEVLRGPVPHVVPVLRHEQRQLPAVAVNIDRVGAEIAVLLPHAEDEMISVKGKDSPVITRSSPGGWSQYRFQHRAENQWKANAGLVADQLTELVDTYRPRVVVAAGDVRAVQLLRDQLPERVTEVLVDDATEYQNIDDVITIAAQKVHDLAVEDVRAALEKFAEERGQGDRAAEGVADVVMALAQGQASTVLLQDDSDLLDEKVFVGHQPMEIFASRSDAEAAGVSGAAEAPLGDAVARAALTTDAEVLLVPLQGDLVGLSTEADYENDLARDSATRQSNQREPGSQPDPDRTIPGGIAAILRWSTPD